MRTTTTKTALTFRTMAPLTRSHYKNAHDKPEGPQQPCRPQGPRWPRTTTTTMTTRTKKITLTTWTGRSFATRQKRTRKQCKCNGVLLVILLPSAAITGGKGGREGTILAAFNRVNTVTQRPSCSESLSAATACERKDIVSHSSITLSFRNSPCGLPAFTGSIAT